MSEELFLVMDDTNWELYPDEYQIGKGKSDEREPSRMDEIVNEYLRKVGKLDDAATK